MFTEIDVAPYVTSLTVDVLANVLERLGHARTDPAHRTVDLPAQVRQARPGCMQKGVQYLFARQAPQVRSFVGPNLRDLFVRAEAERLHQALRRLLLPDRLAQTSFAGVEGLLINLRAHAGQQCPFGARQHVPGGHHGRPVGPQFFFRVGLQRSFDGVEVAAQCSSKAPLHDQAYGGRKQRRPPHISGGPGPRAASRRVVQLRVKASDGNRAAAEASLSADRRTLHPLVRRFQPFHIEPQLLRGAEAPRSAALVLLPAVGPRRQARSTVPSIGVCEQRPDCLALSCEHPLKGDFVPACCHCFSRPQTTT